jgi:hypothetical protein
MVPFPSSSDQDGDMPDRGTETLASLPQSHCTYPHLATLPERAGCSHDPWGRRRRAAGPPLRQFWVGVAVRGTSHRRGPPPAVAEAIASRSDVTSAGSGAYVREARAVRGGAAVRAWRWRRRRLRERGQHRWRLRLASWWQRQRPVGIGAGQAAATGAVADTRPKMICADRRKIDCWHM